jgi:hypothetical protein
MLRLRKGGAMPPVHLAPLWFACGHLYDYISGFNKNCGKNVLK